MAVILFVLIGFFLMTIVSGVYVFIFCCVRRKEMPWLVAEELNKTPYEKFSEHIQDADRWLREHHTQDLWIRSHDGLKLHGLWVPANDPKGTILLAHGYRSCPLLEFGLAFSYFHDLGYNMLIPDQRSHGKSEGRIITFGVKESKDMQSWIAYHNKQFTQIPMLLCGISMGASTMLYLANRKLPDNVKGIIADCGFTSPKEILSRVFRDVTHLPALPSVVVAEFCARCFGGFSLWECDTRKSLADAHIPVAIIHGKEDGFVPCEMSKEGFDACTGAKQLLLVDGADHGMSFFVDPEKYMEMITAFINKNL